MFAGFLLLARLWHLPCVFQRLFGGPCPGCGMARAWLSVFRGQLPAAFAHHPLFRTVPLLYGYLLALDICSGGSGCLGVAGAAADGHFRSRGANYVNDPADRLRAMTKSA